MAGERWEQAYQLLVSGRPAEAAQFLYPLAQQDPGDYQVRLYLGAAYLHQGLLEQAEQELRTAAALQPREAEPHYWLGLLLQRRGDAAAAERELKAALAINPGHTAAAAALQQPVARTPAAPRRRRRRAWALVLTVGLVIVVGLPVVGVLWLVGQIRGMMHPTHLLGKPVPELALPDMSGNRVSLTALRGSPIVLNFWGVG